MLYHDMMFCQRFYPHDAPFVANVKAELTEQVTRLMSHPSIVLWDSSNENEGDPAFFYSTVLTTIARTDPSRPLWPASPSSGFDKGVHTSTGLPNGNALVGRFAGTLKTLDTHMPYDFCTAAGVTSTTLNGTKPTYFKSEFGQVSLPAWETLAGALNGSLGDWGVNSAIMVYRKHAGPDLSKPLTSLFGLTAAELANTSEAQFKRVIFLSQLAQTLCIKTYFEELRRGSGTFGGLLWQLNDVWQASSWGSLDYGGRWRALHHSFQAVLAPTVVSAWIDGAAATLRVYGSHHGAAAAGGASETNVEINVTDVATGVAMFHTVVDGIDGKGSAVIAELLTRPLKSLDPRSSVLLTRLINTTALPPAPIAASETTHLLLSGDVKSVADVAWVSVDANDVTMSVASTAASDTASAAVTVQNSGSAPLFFALVTTTFLGRFSRNLLTVPPKSARTIDFLFYAAGSLAPTAPVDLAAFQKSLRIDWLNKASAETES